MEEEQIQTVGHVHIKKQLKTNNNNYYYYYQHVFSAVTFGLCLRQSSGHSQPPP